MHHTQFNLSRSYGLRAWKQERFNKGNYSGSYDHL